MDVLFERHLGLSRKKSRVGSIEKTFHFLGIEYPGTQPLDNITTSQVKSTLQALNEHKMTGGGYICSAKKPISPVANRIVPHTRTLRKAREQVRLMVADGFSNQQIRSYLQKWALWWVRTTNDWTFEGMLKWYMQVCWSEGLNSFASDLLSQHQVKAVAPALGLRH